jgi:hypothetical protein
MTRNYTPEQLKMYRDAWVREVKEAEETAALQTVLEDSIEGTHLTPRLGELRRE